MMLLDRNLSKTLQTSVLVTALALAGACSSTSTDQQTPDTDSQAPTQDGGSQPQDPRAAQEQRVDTYVQSYLDYAEAERRAGNLEAALTELLKARDLDPTNEEVNRRIAAINAELGRPAGGVSTFAKQVQEFEQIREQRARQRVAAAIERARDAIERGQYELAIDELERAQIEIEVNTFVSWNGLDDQVETLITEAREQQLENEKAQLAAASERAAEQLRAVERARSERRRAAVARELNLAARAFDQRKYSLAIDFAQSALSRDPRNEVATEILSASRKAQRDAANDRYHRQLAYRIRRRIEADDAARLPQNDILEVNLEQWGRATERAASLTFDRSLPLEDEALRERLRQESVTNLTFDNEEYNEVRTRLQTITSIPIVITPAARDVIDSEGLQVSLTITSPISLSNLLTQLVTFSEGLTWTVNEGVVEITSREAASGNNVQRIVDVRDLIFPQTQFTPPEISEIPVTDGGFSEQPRTGGELDEKLVAFEIDGLVSTLRDSTDPMYWDNAPDARMEPIENGYLLIVANPRQQERVQEVLRDLRRFSTSVVTIESKFLTLTQNFLQEIGVDFRGLGGSGNPGTVVSLDDITNGLDDNAGAGLDNGGTGDPGANPLTGVFFNDGGDGDVRGRTENLFNDALGTALSSTGGLTSAIAILTDTELQALIRAVEKQQDVQELNGQNLTVLNNGRGHVAVINQTAYVKDFDVEVAQAAFIADPKVDVVQDGVVLDVKPTISYDRKQVTLDLQPTVAELLLPIPTFSTSLAGTTQPVNIQLPVLVVQSYQTTATVPDGGSVLIGGLREISSLERRAEVPVLGRIPFVGFLFKQEGVSDERSTLAVLVRATITDVLDRMDEVDGRRI